MNNRRLIMHRLIFFIIISCLSSCSTSSDNYFVRWWNGNLPLSDNEQRAWNACLKESEIKYSDDIDPLEEKRIKYRRECMKNKGY